MMRAKGADALGAGAPLCEVWRGDVLECVHMGHAVIARPGGTILESWGAPGLTVLPRSACKMVQALPLVEAGLAGGPRRRALACASHEGAPVHVEGVGAWLADLGASEADLRCGAQPTRDRALRDEMIRAGRAPDQRHNNCSGKHAGFVALARHLGAEPDYVEVDHPVQVAVRAALEDAAGETSPAHVIDGCSAPNFALTLRGLAAAMARFAAAGEGGGREGAMHALRTAMAAHPDLVAGEGRACTGLIRAMEGVAVKTGAEGVFCAIVPAPRGPLGIALKVADGATRAAECAIGALLVRVGALDAAHPEARARMAPELRNWRGLVTGRIAPAAALA